MNTQRNIQRLAATMACLAIIGCSDKEPYGEQLLATLSLTVDQQNVILDDEGKATVQLTASQPDLQWKLYNHDTEWLNISGQNSYGWSRGNVTLQLEASKENPKTTDRHATISIESDFTNVLTSFTVVQKGAFVNAATQQLVFPVAGGTQDISFNTNTGWKLTCPTWIKASSNTGEHGQHTVTLTADKNPDDAARKDKIVISSTSSDAQTEIAVSQTEVSLSVNPAKLSFSQAGGTLSVSVEANEAWTVRTNSYSSNWCSVSSTGGTGNGTFSVTLDKNTSTWQRTTWVEVHCGNVHRTIDIEQEACDELYFSTYELSIDAAAGSKTFNVYSNTSWQASSSERWCSVSPQAATANSTLTINVAENLTDEVRTATVTVSTGHVDQQLSVKQSGQYLLDCSTTELVFGPSAGTKQFSFTSNTNWIISSQDSWCKPTPTSGRGDATIGITVETNPTNRERSTRLTITAGSRKHTIVIRQQESIVPPGEDDNTLPQYSRKKN